jgi:hypothetical protein
MRELSGFSLSLFGPTFALKSNTILLILAFGIRRQQLAKGHEDFGLIRSVFRCRQGGSE